MDLPFACNSSRELQPPIDSGSAISLLSDTLSSNICIRKKKKGWKNSDEHSIVSIIKTSLKYLLVKKKLYGM